MITRQEIDELAAATGFSGVVRIDRGGHVELAAACSGEDLEAVDAALPELALPEQSEAPA